MNKPIKPTKYIWQSKRKDFQFDHVSNKVSLQHFIEWCKNETGKTSKDVCISFIEEVYEGEQWESVCTYLQLSWQEKVLNTKYVSELSKYNKKMLKFKEQK